MTEWTLHEHRIGGVAWAGYQRGPLGLGTMFPYFRIDVGSYRLVWSWVPHGWWWIRFSGVLRRGVQ